VALLECVSGGSLVADCELFYYCIIINYYCSEWNERAILPFSDDERKS
jgi:hypothetical protein